MSFIAAKHWAIAFKLLEPQGEGKYYNVSEFARKLLLDDGSDPYLEDPQSQWLLHWNLLREPCYLKTWQWFFTSSTQLSLIQSTRQDSTLSICATQEIPLPNRR
ncbi:DUF4007 family protein [Phormidium sp. FACHB-592]|nr:DUF4007 family protein [Phormidium sp. FACHB-592]